jgi:aminoacyl tRNA synthase complex-interacting multifunctional protein 1
VLSKRQRVWLRFARLIASLCRMALFDALLAHTKLANDVDKKNPWSTFFERLVKVTDDDRGKFLGQARKLDGQLESVTFLHGEGMTLGAVDLLVFAGLHEAGFFKLTREEYNQVPNIARWYAHVQYLVHGAPGLQHFELNEEPLPKREKVDAKKEGGAKKNDAPKEGAGAAVGTPKEGGGKKGGEKKEAAAPKEAGKKAPAAAPAGQDEDLFGQLDLRVGLVVDVSVHPKADKIYVEQIDVGEAVPRTILSGLRPFVKAEDFKGKQVLVICNLKPRKIQDIESNGMVLCCSNADHSQVHLISPSTLVKPGTRVTLSGHAVPDKHPAVLNPKKKVWESAAPLLAVVEEKGHFVSTYKGAHLECADGVKLVSSSTGSIG